MGDGLEDNSNTTPKLKTLYELYDSVFPYYLDMGMTYDLFWNDRPELVKAYSKANKLRNNRVNQEMWLQGIYVRHALASTVGNMFVKNKSDMNKYPDKPIPLTVKEFEEDKEAKEKEKFELMKLKMRLMSENINNHIKNTKGVDK